MFVIIPTKKHKGLCVAYRCKAKHTPRDRFCSKHRHRYRKEADPVKYTYQTLKSNARRRGKVFTITLEYFRKFCEDTGYLQNKGRYAKAASIDRKDHTKGYEPGNLQILSLADNSAKRWQDEDPTAANYCPF